MRRKLFIALLAAGMANGCSDNQGPGPGMELPPTPFLVSGPSPAPEGLMASRSTHSSTVAYVSLAPETMIQGTSATITNSRLPGSVTVPIVDGGFDPVPISAALGDTLIVTVQGNGGQPVRSLLLVKAAPPVIVRTSPRRNKRDVPLNVRVVVVFSAPINPATLTSSTMQLSTGGVVVSGQLAFVDTASIVAEFQPAAPLAAATEYQLSVSPGIRGVDGRPLAAALTLQFTTVDPNAPLPSAWPWLISRAVPYPSGKWTFISAPPGSLPAESYVTAKDGSYYGPRSGTGAYLVGGLDPLAVQASTGDTFRITVHRKDGSVQAEYLATVPATSVPVVVRSDPASGAVDARTDMDLLVMFSEPITVGDLDEMLPNHAQLEAGGQPVAGAWSATGWVPPPPGSSWATRAPYRAIFIPAAPLMPGTSYRLVLTSGLTGDMGGTPIAPHIIPFTTLSPPPGPLDAVLAIQSFSMIEYQYPGDTLFYYAPRLQLAETGGREDALLTRIGFTLPEYPWLADMCAMGTSVLAGQSAGMFGIAYGDYELSYFTTDGTRAGPGQATVAVVYRDAVGRTDTVTAEGPVVQGSIPDMYFEGSLHSYFDGTPGCQNPWYLRSPGAAASAQVHRATQR